MDERQVGHSIFISIHAFRQDWWKRWRQGVFITGTVLGLLKRLESSEVFMTSLDYYYSTLAVID